jgi:hypothetical protein
VERQQYAIGCIGRCRPEIAGIGFATLGERFRTHREELVLVVSQVVV